MYYRRGAPMMDAMPMAMAAPAMAMEAAPAMARAAPAKN